MIGRKNRLFSDTPRAADASAAIYSIIVACQANGLNQRAYLEWLLAKISNNESLREPVRIDRHLPWSEDAHDSCRLATSRVNETVALQDEPIVDAKLLETPPEIPSKLRLALRELLTVSKRQPESSRLFPTAPFGKLLANSKSQAGR